MDINGFWFIQNESLSARMQSVIIPSDSHSVMLWTSNNNY